MFIVIRSGLLPGKYLGMASAVVAVLLLITVLFACAKNGAVRSIGSVLSIFVCGMLVFGMVYMNQVMKTLNSVAGSDTEVKCIAVSVEKNNAANCIEDTHGYRFGVFAGTDSEQIDETAEEVKKANGDADLNREDYDSLVEMAQALIDGEIDAAICNKAYIEILDDVIMNFTSDTRIIYEKEFETKANEQSGDENTKAQSNSLTDHSYNVLISGIDVSGPITITSRSDVNIIMTVNPLMHQILLTTTPRDYYVYLPGISGDMRDKLTHAGIYGVKTSMRTLEELYETDIQHFIRINFDSLVLLVDALGGVDVYSEYSFDARGYSFYKGTNHMNGEQALAFSRARYAFAQGDKQRGRNQTLVLTAIINKLMSPALLKNPSGVLDVVGKSMQTSIQTAQITKAIAWQLDSGEGWDIDRQSVDGTGDSEQTFSMQGINSYVMWPDEDSVSRASEKIREVMGENEDQ